MKELMFDWVEERIFEDEDGTWFRGDPQTGEPENDKRYATEDALRESLWGCEAEVIGDMTDRAMNLIESEVK